jgi:hypothetical protein
MSKFPWPMAGEAATAADVFSGAASAYLPGIARYSLEGKRDAVLAELISGGGASTTSTINAITFFTGGATKEQAITQAIAFAVSLGMLYVYVPQSMLPYNANLVTFNTSVLMLAESANDTKVVSVKAYGAAGDGVTDDSAAFIAALAYAAANVEFFGTSLIATPPVVIPTLTSPNPQTKSYLITQTLALPAGLRMRGTGSFGAVLQFVPTVAAGGGTANNATLFTYFGAVEAQAANILLENIYCFQNGAVQTSIGFRMRNCSFIQLRNCVFANFRVGAWLDWGQDLDCYDTQFSICSRGAQLGGNLSQPEFPQPPAGVRHSPLQANPWMDNASFLFCKFSQNLIDLNHLGCSVSHGCTLLANCTFFESSTSPVTSKTRFIHTTLLKGLTVLDCWFEAGADGRTGVVQSAFDFDGNAGGQNLGGLIQGNHFLLTGFTGGASSVICVDIESGAATIMGNVLEINSLATHIKLADTSRASTVLQNSYLSYPDTLLAPVFNITGKHQILEPLTTSRLGSAIIDDPSVAQLQFNIAEARQAGINVAGADTIRFFNSVGTIRQQLVMGGGINGARWLQDGVVWVPLGPGSTFTIDASTGGYFTPTVNAAATFNAPTNAYAGQRITITVIQNGTGGFAVSWNVIFKVSWSDTGNTAGKRSTVSFQYDGTNWNQIGAQTPYV